METRVDLAIRSWVAVDASVDQAFDVFTHDVNTWWPLETNSIRAAAGHGPPDEIRIERWEGGRIYERTGDEVLPWGSVVRWDPPDRIVLEWQVNPQFPPTEVEVRFTADGDDTRVEVVHGGWELAGAWGLADASAREERVRYTGRLGWDWVLGHYVLAVGA
jgi:hypothetical protein